MPPINPSENKKFSTEVKHPDAVKILNNFIEITARKITQELSQDTELKIRQPKSDDRD